METILGRIRREKEDFRTKSVRISPYYQFNQYKVLQKIELYLNSKFETGEFDDRGFKKYFYNVIIQPCEVATKEIDLDTKDVIVRPEDGDDITAYFMAKDLHQWLKDHGIAATLNQMADEGPRYGSVVVKHVEKTNDIYSVDLVNGFILTNQSANTLKQTDTIEIHGYSFQEMEEQKWDKAKIKEAIDLYRKIGKSVVEVDERYGWVKESELKAGGNPDKYVYTLAIVAGAEEVEKATESDKVVEKGVVLYHEEIDPKNFPYTEWHFGRKVKNRWLRVGFAEALLDAQIARNESKYYNRQALQWSSIRLFSSDDDTVASNLLIEKTNGDVVKTQQGRSITPLAMEERNLAHYQSEDADWDRLVSTMTFSGDVMSGESLPSGTTARAAVLSNDNARRFFDRKREDFGIVIRDVILDKIMPRFIKDRRKEHIFTSVANGAERDKLEGMIFNLNVSTRFDQFVKENNRIPSALEWQVILGEEQSNLSRQQTLSVIIPEAAYDNFKYKLDVVITRENEDTDAKIQGKQLIIQSLSANPAITTNPVTRGTFLELADLLGAKNLQLPQSITPPMAQELTPGSPMAAPATEMV